jgi:hypothetical protein
MEVVEGTGKEIGEAGMATVPALAVGVESSQDGLALSTANGIGRR